MISRCRAVSWGVLLLALVACRPPAPAPFDEAAWKADIEAWRGEREKHLRDPEGWLTLAGLYWLKEGANSFGADPGNDLVFPAGKAPGKIGVLRREGSTVSVVVEPGVGLAADGTPITVSEFPLAADASGKPTLLTLGSLAFHLIRRGERVGIRLRDKESPLLASFSGMKSFPLGPSWRVTARFEPYTPAKTIKIPNVLGDVSDSPCPGALVFEYDGQTLRLEPIGSAGEEMFLVFGDGTNGRETYGGGRFLDLPAPSADGTVVVDFNLAYNPPCVFTPYATCPLPPRQNRLAVAIEAGELMFEGGVAHVADVL